MGGRRTRPSRREVADCFSRHGGDLRETLFDLYDLYEQRSEPSAGERKSRLISGVTGTQRPVAGQPPGLSRPVMHGRGRLLPHPKTPFDWPSKNSELSFTMVRCLSPPGFAGTIDQTEHLARRYNSYNRNVNHLCDGGGPLLDIAIQSRFDEMKKTLFCSWRSRSC